MAEPCGAGRPAAAGTGDVDWARAELPDSWVDRLDLRNPAHLWRFLRAIASAARAPVQMPLAMPGAPAIPRYVLRQFHNLPNGNYSNGMARHYAAAFDRVMLGSLRATRARIAQALVRNGAARALDIGCGGGHMAAALVDAGAQEVWGIDPSPYLLKAAAQAYPGLRLRQAVLEDTGFPDAHFDAVGICFVLHEIPPRQAARGLAEVHRVLRPGGRLGVIEPSRQQRDLGHWALWRRHGWRGCYFRLLAGAVHEPFLAAWHRRDLQGWFEQAGFRVLEDEDGVPSRALLLERR